MNIIESNEIPIYVNQKNQALLYLPDKEKNRTFFNFFKKRYYFLRRGTLKHLEKCDIQDNELMYIQDLKKLAIRHGENYYIIPTRIIKIEDDVY